MNAKTKNILAQVVGVGIALALLYLALRNVDFSRMWDTLRKANYWWLIPLVLITLVAHFFRAWRWRMFLDALPSSESTRGAHRVDLKTAFYAVMIGYLLNLAVPRLGEVARAANLSSQSGLRFSSVFGTVVIERILDFVALVLILVAVGFVLVGSPAAERILFHPLRDRLDSFTSGEILLVLIIVIAGVALLFWLPRFLKSRHGKDGGILTKLKPILRSFRLGLISLFTSPHRIGITVTTVAIWFCYWLMLFLPLYMLDMIGPYGLNATTGLVLLGIGSIGFVLPAPGGIGSFHYFVIETLVQIFAVPYEIAAGFAVLTHAAQTVLLTIVGFACLLLQGSSFGNMLRAAQRVEEDSTDEPTFKARTE